MQYGDTEADNTEIMQLAQDGIKHAYKNEKLMHKLERELLVTARVSPSAHRRAHAGDVWAWAWAWACVRACVRACARASVCVLQSRRSLRSVTSMKKARLSSIATANRAHSGTHLSGR